MGKKRLFFILIISFCIGVFLAWISQITLSYLSPSELADEVEDIVFDHDIRERGFQPQLETFVRLDITTIGMIKSFYKRELGSRMVLGNQLFRFCYQKKRG